MANDENYCGLYLLTPEKIDDIAAFARDLDAVLATGAVDCVQLRLKGVADEVIIAAAESLLTVCHAYEIPLLINDRADIAAKVDADGVHLGQDDGDIASTRSLLGADKDIGVTCHNSKDLAFVAGDQGANYIAFGAFFPSSTKKEATVADKQLLTDWDEVTDLPCVAIGGITPENCGELKAAGAHLVAVCSAVWNAPEGPVAAVKQFRKALDA